MNQTKITKNLNSNLRGTSGFVKLYAHGKLGLVFYGDRRFIETAERCFAKSIQVMLKFNREEFETQMRRYGISADIINKFSEGFSLENDIWLSKGSNWPN